MREITNLKQIEKESKDSYIALVMVSIITFILTLVSTFTLDYIGFQIMFSVFMILCVMDKKYWDMKHYMIKNFGKDK